MQVYLGKGKTRSERASCISGCKQARRPHGDRVLPLRCRSSGGVRGLGGGVVGLFALLGVGHGIASSPAAELTSLSAAPVSLRSRVSSYAQQPKDIPCAPDGAAHPRGNVMCARPRRGCEQNAGADRVGTANAANMHLALLRAARAGSVQCSGAVQRFFQNEGLLRRVRCVIAVACVQYASLCAKLLEH